MKKYVLLALAGLPIGFAVPAFAQRKDPSLNAKFLKGGTLRRAGRPHTHCQFSFLMRMTRRKPDFLPS
jgi:hypothetical protein